MEDYPKRRAGPAGRMDNQFKDPVAARLFAEVIETIAKAQEFEDEEKAA